MLIRKTEEKDLAAISEIYSLAKQYMRAAGNKNQWSGDYPNEDSARDDMEKGIGYVCEDKGEVLAVFAFEVGEENTYNQIYDGAWLNGDKYAYIHTHIRNHCGNYVDNHNKRVEIMVENGKKMVEKRCVISLVN